MKEMKAGCQQPAFFRLFFDTYLAKSGNSVCFIQDCAILILLFYI